MSTISPLRIFVADDDEEDIQIMKEALAENHLDISLETSENGQLLLDKLRSIATDKIHTGSVPHLILMDLNMPTKNGFEALKEIREDKQLCTIPVLIFSTSKAQHDISYAYELGANCFVPKPNTIDEWVMVMGKIGSFWAECATLAYD